MVRVGFVRDEDHGFEALVIEDEASQDRIEVQRSLMFDEQDRALGQDTYCLFRAPGATSYGGIEGWALKGAVLVLDLTAESAADLELARRTEIGIDEGHELLQQHLERLLQITPATS